VGADDHCYEREDLINNTARPCAALYGPCETSSEQYFKRAVLGVHEAILVNVTEQVTSMPYLKMSLSDCLFFMQ
jgi:hypothetical protein